MKKLAMVVMVLFFVMGMAAVSGAAWYTCNVNNIGVYTASNPIVYFLTVTETVGTDFPAGTTFLIDTTNVQAKTMYATALTGYSSNSKVGINLDSVTPFSFVVGVQTVP